MLRHRQGRRVGELVGRAHHEPLKGVLLRAGEEQLVGLLLAEVLQLPLSQHHHLKVGGEQLVQRLLDGGQVAGHDDVPLEVGGGVENKPVGLQSHRHGVVKPGVDGGGGHVPLRLHQREHLGPDVGREIHEKTTSFEKYHSTSLYQKFRLRATDTIIKKKLFLAGDIVGRGIPDAPPAFPSAHTGADEGFPDARPAAAIRGARRLGAPSVGAACARSSGGAPARGGPA